MAQDLKKLFEKEQKMSTLKMPEGHEDRFIDKLDRSFPEHQSTRWFTFFNMAASVVVLIGLSFAAYHMYDESEVSPEKQVVDSTSIGEISPQLKKVEDYYLANINLELSKLKYNPENKELFDGYVRRLGELSSAYEVLSEELIKGGPNEQTVTALIDNLKLRLNLMYRLKEKLNELNEDSSFEEVKS